MRKLCPDGAVLLYRGDGPFNENLFYLTGLDVYNAAVVIDLSSSAEHAFTWPVQFPEARAQTDIEAVSCSDAIVDDAVHLLRSLRPRTVHVEWGLDSAQPCPAEFIARVVDAIPGARLAGLPDQLAALRAEKDDWELRCLSAAALNAANAMAVAEAILEPGVTEQSVAAEIMASMVRGGARRPSMPIVAFGPHTLNTHHVPTPRPLADGDVVLIDVYGEAARNYCCELTNMFFFGMAEVKVREVVKTVARVLDETSRLLRPGIPLAEVDRAAEAAFDREGLASHYPGRCTHMVGLSEHDPTDRKAALAPGNVVAIEPALYWRDLRAGVRFERTFAVTTGGRRPLP